METKLKDEKSKKFNRRHQTLFLLRKEKSLKGKIKKCLAVTENVRTRIVHHRSRHHQQYFVLLNLRHFLNSFESFSSFDYNDDDDDRECLQGCTGNENLVYF
jgi:hypothetical protein